MRKSFTTTIEEQLQKDFKEKCNVNNDKMNDVLEAFMQSYINGEFELEVKFNLKKVQTMREIKDRHQAELLLESAKKSLIKETELFEKTKDAEIKKLHLDNVNKFKKVIADIERDLQEK